MFLIVKVNIFLIYVSGNINRANILRVFLIGSQIFLLKIPDKCCTFVSQPAIIVSKICVQFPFTDYCCPISRDSHPASYNPAIITKQKAHMVNKNMNTMKHRGTKKEGRVLLKGL